MSLPPVLEYCRARHALRALEERTRVERSEQRDAKRALGELVIASMRQYGIECAQLPGPAGEAPTYVRLATPALRAKPISSEEEARSLLSDVEANVKDVPAEHLADEIVRLVQARMRQGGSEAAAAPPPSSARVSHVRHRPRNTPVCEAPPPEVRRLVDDYQRACDDCTASRSQLQPHRAAVRSHERDLLQTLHDPVAVRMRGPDGSERTARVVRRPLRRRAAPRLGARAFLKIVRGAVEETLEARLVGRFEEELSSLVGRRVAEALQGGGVEPGGERITLVVAKGGA